MTLLDLDRPLFLLLNGTVDTPGEAWFWMGASSLGNAAVALMLVVALVHGSRRSLRAVAISFLLGTLVIHGCKLAFEVARPLSVLGPEVIVSGPRLFSNSFLSGHSATIASVATLLFHHWGQRRWSMLPLAMLALVCGSARVAVGAHWPVDVAAGLLAGAVCAQIGWLAAGTETQSVRCAQPGRSRRLDRGLEHFARFAGVVGWIIVMAGGERDLAPIIDAWRVLGVLIAIGVLWRWWQRTSIRRSGRADLHEPLQRSLLKPLLKRLLKPLLGVLLLALLVSSIDAERIARVLKATELRWFAIAILFAVLNNLISALRWRDLARAARFPLGTGLALRRYFEGVTANSVLPGGIVGGDLWRALSLSRIQPGRGWDAGSTVLLDRVSGVWMLFLLAALSGAWMIAAGQMPAARLWKLWWCAMLAGAAGPLLFAWLHARERRMAAAPRFLRRIASHWPALRDTLPQSLCVQICAAATLWACLKAVDVPLTLVLVNFVGAAIFLASILPASIGGFGAREAAAVGLLAPIGIPSDQAFAASLLFGLTVTVQGLLGLRLWLRREQSFAAAPGQATIAADGRASRNAGAPARTRSHR